MRRVACRPAFAASAGALRAVARQVAATPAAWLAQPKLTLPSRRRPPPREALGGTASARTGERRLVDLTGIEPVTS